MLSFDGFGDIGRHARQVQPGANQCHEGRQSDDYDCQTGPVYGLESLTNHLQPFAMLEQKPPGSPKFVAGSDGRWNSSDIDFPLLERYAMFASGGVRRGSEACVGSGCVLAGARFTGWRLTIADSIADNASCARVVTGPTAGRLPGRSILRAVLRRLGREVTAG